jgi:hypothetical protein
VLIKLSELAGIARRALMFEVFATLLQSTLVVVEDVSRQS